MGRRARVDRTPEQKLEIVLQGMKSGNIAETCRRYEVAPNLYYRWKDEALQGATAALGVRSAAAVESEKGRPLPQTPSPARRCKNAFTKSEAVNKKVAPP